MHACKNLKDLKTTVKQEDYNFHLDNIVTKYLYNCYYTLTGNMIIPFA